MNERTIKAANDILYLLKHGRSSFTVPPSDFLALADYLSKEIESTCTAQGVVLTLKQEHKPVIISVRCPEHDSVPLLPTGEIKTIPGGSAVYRGTCEHCQRRIYAYVQVKDGIRPAGAISIDQWIEPAQPSKEQP